MNATSIRRRLIGRRRQAPATLREALRRGLFNAAKVASGLAIGCLPLLLVLEPPVGTLHRADVAVEQGPDRIAQLIERGDCWTRGQAQPADVDYPAAVVVTRPDGRVVLSARLVDAALSQVFGGVDAGLEVHAFCRSSR